MVGDLITKNFWNFLQFFLQSQMLSLVTGQER